MIDIQDIRTTDKEEIKVNGRWRRPKWKCSRSVFLIEHKNKNIVIKIDDSGQVANEVEVLSNLDKQDKKYFPKLYKHGTINHWDYVVMSYEKTDRRKTITSKHWQKIHKLANKYNLEDLNWSCENGRQQLYDNWGLKPNGSIMILDAGV